MHDDSVEEIQVSPLISIGAKLENDATIEQSSVVQQYSIYTMSSTTLQSYDHQLLDDKGGH